MHMQVPGLTHVTVSSAEEVLKLLELGGSARAVAATGVHDHSSRSHSVLLAEVASRAGPDALPATGRLFLGGVSCSMTLASRNCGFHG